jgi:MSHA pilin protein MshD
MADKSTYPEKNRQTSKQPHHLSPDTGFSLIELIIIIVILGFLTAIMVPFIQSFLRSPDPMFRQQAVALGQALMDEIVSKRWDENTAIGGGPLNTDESSRGTTGATAVADLGADAGETRATYDDVDDYNGFSETTDFYDQTGAISITLNGFSRQAAVTYIASNTTTIDSSTAASATTTDTKMIVVSVTSPINETYTFVTVSCNL